MSATTPGLTINLPNIVHDIIRGLLPYRGIHMDIEPRILDGEVDIERLYLLASLYAIKETQQWCDAAAVASLLPSPPRGCVTKTEAPSA